MRMKNDLLRLIFLILWSIITTTDVIYGLPNSNNEDGMEALEDAVNRYNDVDTETSCNSETETCTNADAIPVKHEDNNEPTWYDKVSEFGNRFLKENVFNQNVDANIKFSLKQRSDSFSNLATMDHYNHQRQQATSGSSIPGGTTTNFNSNDYDGDFDWSLNFDFIKKAEEALTKVSNILTVVKTAEQTPPPTKTTNMNTTTSNNGKDDGYMKLLEYIAKESTDQHSNNDDYSIMEAVQLFKGAFDEAIDQFQRNELNVLLASKPAMTLSDLRLHLVAFWYYLRNEEEKKNSVWKRKVHYYDPKLYDVSTLNRLHNVLYLSHLAYANTEQDIHDSIEKFENNTWKVLYATTITKPKEPAHYMLIRKQVSGMNNNNDNDDDRKTEKGGLFQNVFYNKQKKSKDDEYLEVTIVVRGTAGLGDVFTDIMNEPVPYRGYKGHAGMIESAKNLVNKHGPKLVELLKLSGREYIKLWVFGHSLGAGTAALMAIEFEEEYAEYIEARSIGFGTPAVLSPELSTKYKDLITTIVSDADCVPRLTAASVTNLILDIVDFDWSHYALGDVEPFLLDLRKYIPPMFGKDLLSDDFIYNKFLVWMDDHLNKTVRTIINERKKIKEETLTLVKKALDENEATDDSTKNKTNSSRSSGASSSSHSGEYRVPTAQIPPGNCIHLFRDGPGVTGSYTPCTFFSEIEFVPTLIHDHLIPTGYQRLMLGLARDIANDFDYKFPHDLMSLPIT